MPYRITQEAVNKPRRVCIDTDLNIWVTIGAAPITIPRKPPRRPAVVPVATQEQLEYLYNNRKLHHLIEIVPVETE